MVPRIVTHDFLYPGVTVMHDHQPVAALPLLTLVPRRYRGNTVHEQVRELPLPGPHLLQLVPPVAHNSPSSVNHQLPLTEPHLLHFQ